MLTWYSFTIGTMAAIIVGLSKTALPGAGLIATPLFALVAAGRGITGTTLPILLIADLFAVGWYRQHADWNVLKPLVAPVVAGFAAGLVFFVAVGNDVRLIEVTIAIIVLFVVGLQAVRMVRKRPPRRATPSTAIAYGTVGGFTTFVSNTAGPIMNTYLVGLGMQRETQIGTSAWFYFAVNAAKIPCFLALGGFFTADSLRYDLALVPAVVFGAIAGRHITRRFTDAAFQYIVLLLSAAGGLKLLLG